MEVQSLDKYLSENEKWILKFVDLEKRLSKMEEPDTFKKHLKEEKTSQWLEKLLHGRFLKNTQRLSTEKTQQWLKGRHLKKETEAMVCESQEQAL